MRFIIFDPKKFKITGVIEVYMIFNLLPNICKCIDLWMRIVETLSHKSHCDPFARVL